MKVTQYLIYYPLEISKKKKTSYYTNLTKQILFKSERSWTAFKFLNIFIVYVTLSSTL